MQIEFKLNKENFVVEKYFPEINLFRTNFHLGFREKRGKSCGEKLRILFWFHIFFEYIILLLL